MEGDVDLPDDQRMTVEVVLAEAMGAEVHVHANLDVPPVAIEGAPVAAERGDEVDAETTHLIARVEGVHTVEPGTEVTLSVKTQFAHFFDPSTGVPLR